MVEILFVVEPRQVQVKVIEQRLFGFGHQIGALIRFPLDVTPEELAFHVSIDEAADHIVEGPGNPGGDTGVGEDDFGDEAVPGQVVWVVQTGDRGFISGKALLV